MAERDFGRDRRWAMGFTTLVLCMLAFAVYSLFAGDPWFAVQLLVPGILFGLRALWGIATPYASVSEAGMTLYRSPIRRSQVVPWETVERLVPWHKSIWYMTLSDGTTLELHVREVASSQRAAFEAMLESRASAR